MNKIGHLQSQLSRDSRQGRLFLSSGDQQPLTKEDQGDSFGFSIRRFVILFLSPVSLLAEDRIFERWIPLF